MRPFWAIWARAAFGKPTREPAASPHTLVPQSFRNSRLVSWASVGVKGSLMRPVDCSLRLSIVIILIKKHGRGQGGVRSRQRRYSFAVTTKGAQERSVGPAMGEHWHRVSADSPGRASPVISPCRPGDTSLVYAKISPLVLPSRLPEPGRDPPW